MDRLRSARRGRRSATDTPLTLHVEPVQSRLRTRTPEGVVPGTQISNKERGLAAAADVLHGTLSFDAAMELEKEAQRG